VVIFAKTTKTALSGLAGLVGAGVCLAKFRKN
jgi:hypothetical protein